MGAGLPAPKLALDALGGEAGARLVRLLAPEAPVVVYGLSSRQGQLPMLPSLCGGVAPLSSAATNATSSFNNGISLSEDRSRLFSEPNQTRTLHGFSLDAWVEANGAAGERRALLHVDTLHNLSAVYFSVCFAAYGKMVDWIAQLCVSGSLSLEGELTLLESSYTNNNNGAGAGHGGPVQSGCVNIPWAALSSTIASETEPHRHGESDIARQDDADIHVPRGSSVLVLGTVPGVVAEAIALRDAIDELSTRLVFDGCRPMRPDDPSYTPPAPDEPLQSTATEGGEAGMWVHWQHGSVSVILDHSLAISLSDYSFLPGLLFLR